MKRIYTPRRQKNILIVDDDEAVASIYYDKFVSERFAVEVADSGEKALQMLATAPADLVILDFSLPGMNGAEVLKSIRSRFGAEVLPIIVFTNFYLPGVVQAASEAGATICVRKSDCTPNYMVKLVQEALAARRAIAANAISDKSVCGSGGPAADPAVSRPVGKTPSEDFETKYQPKRVADFRASSAKRLTKLRSGHHTFINAENEKLRLIELYEMHREARLLAGAAGVAGFRKIAQLASGLESLLLQLHGRPAKIAPSAIRTIAQAVDLLAFQCDHATQPEPEVLAPPAILVVDDEAISREAICSALKKANLNPMSVDNPTVAEGILERSQFDLVFLDVEMPTQSGPDLCARIRKMPTNRTTPVVFVTAHSDFASRAQSSLSGGNDFIAKPFLSVELAVKALTWLFKEKPELLPNTNRSYAEEPLLIPHNQTQSHPALAIPIENQGHNSSH